MSLNAGYVYAILGGKFSPAGFRQFDNAMKQSVASASASEKAIVQSQQRTAQSMHALGRAAKVAAGVGILGIGAAVAYSVKKAADFEQQLSSLQSVTNANGKQMAMFKQQAMQAGAATKYSALQAAQAQTELAKGGLSVTQIMTGGLKSALSLAAAGELDLADAAKFTVNAMKLFGLRGGESIKVADALATAANKTTGDVQDFGMALTQGGAAAKQVGYSFNQTVTLLELLAEVGVKNSDAGTSMKTALLQLVNPTKKAQAAMDQYHLSFKGTNGEMKSLGAISRMLRTETADLSKTERTALFQRIAGTDGFRTLAALYDATPAKIQRLADANTKAGSSAKVAAEKQDNLKGKLENLQGSVETAAIKLGSKLLPTLEQLAVKATGAINGFAAGNGLDQFAAGLMRFGGDMASAFSAAAAAGAGLVGVLTDIANAMNFDGISGLESLIAGFAAFKIAGVVAPMVLTLANNMRLLATAPTLGAMAADLIAMVNPITAIAAAAAVAAGGLLYLSQQESAEAQIASQSAAAHHAQAEAIKSVADAERASADKGLAAQQSTIDLADAEARLHDLRRRGIKSGREYERAELAVRQAKLRSIAAHREYNTQLETQARKAKEAQDTATKTLASENKRNSSLKDQREALQRLTESDQVGRAAANARGAALIRLNSVNRQIEASDKALSTATRDYIQAQARAATTDANRIRLMNGQAQMTTRQAVNVANLIGYINRMPASKRTQLLLEDASALSRLGRYVGQLNGKVPRRKITEILAQGGSAESMIRKLKSLLDHLPKKKETVVTANTQSAIGKLNSIKNTKIRDKAIEIVARDGSAKQKIKDLEALGIKPKDAKIMVKGQGDVLAQIAAIQGKKPRVQVTYAPKVVKPDLPQNLSTTYQVRPHVIPPSLPTNASGRGPGDGGPALVGEGRGPEYVGNARDGFQKVSAATVMGLRAEDYVIPTEPQYRSRAIELMAHALGIPGFKKGKKGVFKGKGKKRRYIPNPLERFAADPDDLKNDLDHLQQRYDGLKQDAAEKKDGKLTKKAKRAKGQLGAAHDRLLRAKEIYKQANAYKARITREEDLIEIARSDMTKADQADNPEAYAAAKGDRKTHIEREIRLLRNAMLKAPKGSKWRRELLKRLRGAEVDLGDNAAEKIDTEAAGTFTEAQQKELDKIDAGLALAELTETKVGPGEDIEVLTQKAEFLRPLLSKAQAAGNSTAVTEIAGMLKTTQGALTDALKPPDPTADQQLTTDQAFQKGLAQGRGSFIDRVVDRAFGGGGQQIIVNTLHPGDPATVRAIGDAAAAGFGYQQPRQASTARVGV